MAVALDEPLGVVAVLEGEECQAQGFDGVEALDPEELFFEGADEAFGAAVALGLADEGGRAPEAEEADLGLEVVADVLESWLGLSEQVFRLDRWSVCRVQAAVIRGSRVK